LDIQDRFYSLAGKIEDKVNKTITAENDPGALNDNIRVGNVNIAPSLKRRRIKLPEASLPTFDGKFKNWLTFQNAFDSMIGSQTDLTDIDKLHYLKSASLTEAGNKIKIFSIDGVNYTKAWELLEQSYEIKRILIT